MELKITPSELEWTEGKVKGFHGKMLIDMENGSLKLIRIDAGATYPVHVHPEKTEYAYILDGEPCFMIGDKEYCGKPGEFFIFPYQTKHAIFNRSDNECKILVGAISK